MANVPSTEQASTNLYWTYGTKEVFNLQTTVRGGYTAEEFAHHLATVKDTLTAIVEIGGHAKPVGQQPTKSEPIIPLIAETPANGQAHVEPLTPVMTGPGEQTMPAELLVGSIIEGKPTWKVKGGRWTNFGVTIWPETLPANIDGKPIVSGNSYPLVGWTAYYTLKADGSGKPQKVTRLVKG